MQTILLALCLALGLGKVIAVFCERVRLPAVVGEILAGLLLANLSILFPAFTIGKTLHHSPFLERLSELGIIFLLFSSGLESNLQTLARVGFRAALVAVVGVASPVVMTFALWKCGFLDHGSSTVVFFIGATLTATSVGVTARILSSAGVLKSTTGQVILNAAVIDDVLGLLILAAASALAVRSQVSAIELGKIALHAGLFFATAIPAGMFLFPLFLKKLKGAEALTVVAFCVCFFLSWYSMYCGLAAIVGAFFAGLLLDDSQGYVEERLKPIVDFLSPLFFILIGAGIDLRALAKMGSDALVVSLVLIVVAILSKVVCGFVAGPKADRWAVGLGMAPRGEVGLIFAMTGKQIGVFSDGIFAVLVFVVLMSTLIPSIALDRYLGSKRGKVL